MNSVKIEGNATKRVTKFSSYATCLQNASAVSRYVGEYLQGLLRKFKPFVRTAISIEESHEKIIFA
jgi:hypothetical protein